MYEDRSFEFVTKTSPASFYLKKYAKITKGASATNKEPYVGKVTFDDCKEIAEIKKEDLNAHDLEAGARIIAGSAASMGIEVIR